MKQLLIPILAFSLTMFEVSFGQEQWLQYRSGRPDILAIDTIGQSLAVSSELPEGLVLKELENDDYLFGCWLSPMASGRGLWITLVRTRVNGPYDIIIIDTNGDLSLEDEQIIDCYRQDLLKTSFGPVKIVFTGDDGPITYHLNIEFNDHAEQKELCVYSGGWYEGEIKIGDQKKYCRLIDYNANGTFNDKALDPSQCDRIQVGKSGDQGDLINAGSYLQIDQTLYQLDIAQDGAYIYLAPAADVIYGIVQIPGAITQLAVGGENGLFTFKSIKDQVKLPAGRYRILAWAMEKNDQGSVWRLEGIRAVTNHDFTVKRSDNDHLEVYGKISAILTIKKLNNSIYSFNQELQGQFGGSLTITKNNLKPPPPQLHIRNKDGSYIQTLSFEYG